jgi:hypoxanthine phosphoribosyltransferase
MQSSPQVLITEAAITARVKELAEEISRDYQAAGELVLVGVLRGAFIFLADLSRCLSVPCSVDFMALSHYEGSTATGAVRLIMDLRGPISGKHVLLVEDIVDSGDTLAYLFRTLTARQPASLKTCVLTRKPDRLTQEVRLDYIGFDIPDRWVVGYGLDYDDRFRTLPFIGVIDPPAGGERSLPDLVSGDLGRRPPGSRR